MNSNTMKNLRPLSRYGKNSSNGDLLKSYKNQISIIKEIKENNKRLNNNKPMKFDSLLDGKNKKKLHKNNSTISLNNKPKLMPLIDSQNKNGNGLYNREDKTKNKAKQFYNKLSLERINFQFEEYGEYPNDDFQPSIYFFKFLANKPDYEKENSEKGKVCTSKLKLFVPDTIVLNDLDTNYWIYTDIEGNVNRIEESDNDVIEKFQPKNDKNELIAVSKMPLMNNGLLGENQLSLLNALLANQGTKLPSKDLLNVVVQGPFYVGVYGEGINLLMFIY